MDKPRCKAGLTPLYQKRKNREKERKKSDRIWATMRREHDMDENHYVFVWNFIFKTVGELLLWFPLFANVVWQMTLVSSLVIIFSLSWFWKFFENFIYNLGHISCERALNNSMVMLVLVIGTRYSMEQSRCRHTGLNTSIIKKSKNKRLGVAFVTAVNVVWC